MKKTMYVAVALFILCTSTVYAVLPSEVALWSDFTDGSGTSVTDQNGKGNSGTLTTGQIWNATDKPANLPYSIEFTSGSAQKLTYASNNRTNVGNVNQSYSMSLWLRTASTTNSYMGVAGQYSTKYPLYMNLDWNGKLHAAVYDGVNNPAFTGSVDIADAQWHHVVFVRDLAADRLLWYVDGVLIGNVSDTTTTSMSQTSNLNFGYNPGSAYYFNGKLAQPVVFLKALSGNEVARLYNNGSGRTYEDYVITANDVAFWSDMSEGTGTTVDDAGPQDTDGALTSGILWTSTDKPLNLPASVIVGANENLSYPSNARTNVGEQGESYSYGVWFKTNTTSNTFMSLVGMHEYIGVNQGQYPIYATLDWNGNLVTALFDGTNNPSSTGSDDLIDSQWHQMVFVRDASADKVFVYVDGTQHAEYNDTTTGNMSQTTPVLFGFNPATNYYFSGNMAQPFLLNTAIGAEDVVALYNSGSGSTYSALYS